MAHLTPDESLRDEAYVDLSADDPDWDLSESAGYGDWEPRRSFRWGKWLMIGLALLLAASLTLPLALRAARFL
jgi:hypothetical protein